MWFGSKPLHASTCNLTFRTTGDLAVAVFRLTLSPGRSPDAPKHSPGPHLWEQRSASEGVKSTHLAAAMESDKPVVAALLDEEKSGKRMLELGVRGRR
eukprot:scaffold88449_cov30-Tisochrysis_lutea.AAC.8